MDCSQCTPEEFSKKTQMDIFEIFEYLQEGKSKEVICEITDDNPCCGKILISKINDKLKIKKL